MGLDIEKDNFAMMCDATLKDISKPEYQKVVR
jgi:hypothetical protein